MTRSDWAALVLCLVAVAAAGWVASHVFEDMAHLEDEFAYLWQAQAAAEGDLTRPSPTYEGSFLVPFVIDYQGQRFGKYPLGWPALLSVGVSFGIRNWVNPLLAGLGVWLIYRLSRLIFTDTVGLLAAGLTALSPFFLIHGGSLLSHTWSLVLTTAFTLSWVEGFLTNQPENRGRLWLAALVSGATLGALALTRPLTMGAVAFPFAVHGLYLLVQGNSFQKKRVLSVGALALGLAIIHFLWQYALTGDFTRNPYTLWWSYDRVGFGPGHGVTAEGHNLQQAWWNTKHSLRAGASDLFGWGKLSWLFLPWGLWAGRKRPAVWLLVGTGLSLVAAYSAYWVGSWLLGPRYYFEALPGLVALTGAGIAWLAGWPVFPVQRDGKKSPPSKFDWSRVRPLLVTGLVALLVAANLLFYLPLRMQQLTGLYTIEHADLKPFQGEAIRELTPALIIVHADPWMSYGSLLAKNTPYHDTPFLFAWSINRRQDAALAE